MMLSLIVLVTLAPAPCAGSDLACTARDSLREAKSATDPRDRAEALLTAARAHLGLYRKTDDRAELCSAWRLIPRKHTEHLGDVPRTTRAEVKAELARLGHDCRPRSQRPTSTPTAIAPPSASEPAATTTAPAAPSDTSASSEPLQVIVASPADDRRGDELIGIERHPTRSVRPAEGQVAAVVAIPARLRNAPTAPSPRGDRPALARPGRGLLIAGGLSLVPASVLVGLAAYSAVRVERLASTYGGLAETATGQGYTDPDADMMRRDLEQDGPHWRRVRIGTSIAAGLVTSAAVALITAGAVKRRRSLERLTLHPLLPGLLMTARF